MKIRPQGGSVCIIPAGVKKRVACKPVYRNRIVFLTLYFVLTVFEQISEEKQERRRVKMGKTGQINM